MAKIESIEILTFEYRLDGLVVDAWGNTVYKPDSHVIRRGVATVIKDSDGAEGQYINLESDAAMTAQARYLASRMPGHSAEAREEHYNEAKRLSRKTTAAGYSNIDIALWDLAGRKAGLSIGTLLGGYRKVLPSYISTFHGDRNGGLSSKEAFADYAVAAREMGFGAFKIHGWSDATRREEAENVLHIRKTVGDGLDLMLDPACELQTFADALYVGRACDDARMFWLEDPYMDGGFSNYAHHKLREMLKTPILMGEHVRGLEAKAETIRSGATDFVRVNPALDMGISGTMKIAHVAEAFGLDVEFHSAGPAQRQCMSAIRNSNYYELTLCAPAIGNPKPPIYACDYSDSPERLAGGLVPVSQLPGLGVVYDWDFVRATQVDTTTFSAE
jgi:L-alanine-DL-glutamate epimerase-like enolase superfamily enzyme